MLEGGDWRIAIRVKSSTNPGGRDLGLQFQRGDLEKNFRILALVPHKDVMTVSQKALLMDSVYSSTISHIKCTWNRCPLLRGSAVYAY